MTAPRPPREQSPGRRGREGPILLQGLSGILLVAVATLALSLVGLLMAALTAVLAR